MLATRSRWRPDPALRRYQHFIRNSIMHGIIRQTGFLVALGALSAGCGSHRQVEEPTPQPEAPSSPATIPYTPVSMEKIPDGLWVDAHRSALEQGIFLGFDHPVLRAAARRAWEEKGKVPRPTP